MKISLRPTLPLKYLIDAHIVLLSYPTKQDFIFDVLSYIVKVSLAKSKKIDPKDIKFSMKTLKYIFGDKLENQEFSEKLKLIMKSMIEDGSLIKNGEYLQIDEAVFLTYYEISN